MTQPVDPYRPDGQPPAADPQRQPPPRLPAGGPNGYQTWPPQSGQPGSPPPTSSFAAQPYSPPHQPLPVPSSGRVEVKVNLVQAVSVMVICLAVAAAFAYWREYYYGDLFDLSDDEGDVNRATIIFHLIPVILIIVAVVYAIRLFDRAPKLIFEAPGVQIHDKSAPDGYRKVGWGQVGRVLISRTAAGRRTLEHWVVLDRQGGVLANVPAAGKAPSPDTGLAQLVSLTGGRIQIG